MASLHSLAAAPHAGATGLAHSAGARRPGSVAVRCSKSDSSTEAADTQRHAEGISRRLALSAAAAAAVAAASGGAQSALAIPAQSLPPSDDAEIKLCSVECEKEIEQFPLETLPSGLQYRDIVKGKGPSPPVGFQVAADYVAMVPSGRVFDSSLEKKTPYIFRVGAGQVVAGLDEGILTMSPGGLRRLYIPGNLSFPKGLASAPGRPRVPPMSPIVFDVKLLYIPGLEEDEE